jgi:biopolymer transport protein ExbD
MAGMTLLPGKGGRKPLDATLNLVPFIDLLSCCISFLLITAVWTQLDRIAAHAAGGGGGDVVDVSPRLLIVLLPEGFRVRCGEQTERIAKQGDAYNWRALAATLKLFQRQSPDRTAVTIASDDRVRYDWLIRTMDTAVGAGLPDIGLVDLPL